jgi:ferredoxin, 2Fe-2S
MPTMNIIDKDGNQHSLDGRSGFTLMEIAVQNDITGIDADCRGSCACATCHVYVDSKWLDRVGLPNELETEMLEIAHDVRENSRLSCQIRITDALDGLEVRVA